MSSGPHRLDSGDPGYASNAWQAAPNVVSGDDFIRSWSLLGGKSHKTFIWNRGDGDDTVDFYFFGQKSGQRRGILRLGLGIAPGEVSLERRGGGVRVVLPGESVTFRKAHWFTGFHHPDAIIFANGTAWWWWSIALKQVSAQRKTEVLEGYVS